MPVNIDEIRKLSDKDKLDLIDEIWESLEEKWILEKYDGEVLSETDNLLQERLAAYKKGESPSYSWEEAEDIIRKNLRKQQDDK